MEDFHPTCRGLPRSGQLDFSYERNEILIEQKVLGKISPRELSINSKGDFDKLLKDNSAF